MGFQDGTFDLLRTRFGSNDLKMARGYWNFIIERVDPGWLENPTGRLAIHWKSDTLPSAVRLIDLARRILILAKGITKESNDQLGAKLGQLLRAESPQYEELRFELLVGSELSRLGVPIELEPRSGDQNADQASRSVDFALATQARPLFVEATVSRIQRLIDWRGAVDDLKARFEREMVKHSCNRQLTIHAPLEVTRKTLTAATIRDLVSEVRRVERGSREVVIDSDSLVLEWRPAPHSEKFPAPRDQGEDHLGFAFTFGSADIAMVAATSTRLKWPGSAEELVVRSLRNTLRGKREQFQLDEAYALALTPGSHLLPHDVVTHIFVNRIFPNAIYGWISALLLFDVQFSQTKGFTTKVSVILNSAAQVPFPKAVLTRALGPDE